MTHELKKSYCENVVKAILLLLYNVTEECLSSSNTDAYRMISDDAVFEKWCRCVQGSIPRLKDIFEEWTHLMCFPYEWSGDPDVMGHVYTNLCVYLHAKCGIFDREELFRFISGACFIASLNIVKLTRDTERTERTQLKHKFTEKASIKHRGENLVPVSIDVDESEKESTSTVKKDLNPSDFPFPRKLNTPEHTKTEHTKMKITLEP